jgi:hypothetical protein
MWHNVCFARGELSKGNTMTLRRPSMLVALLSAGCFAACASQGAGFGDDDGSDDEEEQTGSGASGSSDDDLGDGTGPGSTGAGNASSDGGGGPGGTGGNPGVGGEMGTTGSTGSGGSVGCHDLCEEGDVMDASCDPCVATVCAADPYCCDNAWDETCVGEVASECNLDICGGGSSAIAAGDLVISEVMNNPKAVTDANGEWFELYNASNNAIDLAGLVIRHQEGDPAALHEIATSVIVPAGGYAVLGVNSDPSTNGGIQVDYEWASGTVNLSNTTDFLAIETAEATPLVIDQTSWSELSGLDPDGASRNLDAASLDALMNDDDGNFCPATSVIPGSTDKGSPGAANNACP